MFECMFDLLMNCWNESDLFYESNYPVDRTDSFSNQTDINSVQLSNTRYKLLVFIAIYSSMKNLLHLWKLSIAQKVLHSGQKV